MENTYIPNINIIEKFEIIVEKIFRYKKILKKEIICLENLKEVLLSKMARIKEKNNVIKKC